MNPLTKLFGPTPEQVQAAKDAEYNRQQRVHQRRLAAPARKARRRAAEQSRRVNRTNA